MLVFVIKEIIKEMNVGDKFPDLLGKDAYGNEVKLSDYPGKKFVLYFYPKDNTPVALPRLAVSTTVLNVLQPQAIR